MRAGRRPSILPRVVLKTDCFKWLMHRLCRKTVPHPGKDRRFGLQNMGAPVPCSPSQTHAPSRHGLARQSRVSGFSGAQYHPQTPSHARNQGALERRRAAPDRPLGRALLQRHPAECRWETLNHKPLRTAVAASPRRTDAALWWGWRSERDFSFSARNKALFAPPGSARLPARARRGRSSRKSSTGGFLIAHPHLGRTLLQPFRAELRGIC